VIGSSDETVMPGLYDENIQGRINSLNAMHASTSGRHSETDLMQQGIRCLPTSAQPYHKHNPYSLCGQLSRRSRQDMKHSHPPYQPTTKYPIRGMGLDPASRVRPEDVGCNGGTPLRGSLLRENEAILGSSYLDQESLEQLHGSCEPSQ
jgi:hypothetical protein